MVKKLRDNGSVPFVLFVCLNRVGTVVYTSVKIIRSSSFFAIDEHTEANKQANDMSECTKFHRYFIYHITV